MMFAFASTFAIAFLFGGAPALAQAAQTAAEEAVDQTLSPECRAPGSKLYTIASLRAVKAALRQDRAIRILALGSSSTAGVGASSPLASYPVRLEGELEKLVPGVDMDVANRGVSGEVAAGAARRLRAAVAKAEPDLVIWQLGTNDAIARIGLDTFARSLDETVKWLKSNGIDLVLVDPQYTPSLARDEYYREIVAIIQNTARRDRVPLVRRYESMRYLAGQRVEGFYLARDHFHLNDVGYRCMAEHVARAIAVSLLQPETAAPPASAAAAK